jgi:diguanylate cyclase (GGDEF)-like protein
MFDCPREELYGLTDYDISPLKLAKGYVRDDEYVINSRKVYRYKENEKSGLWYETIKFPLINDKDELYALGGISFNVTAVKKREMTINNIVYNDYLTGIPNRVFLSIEIGKCLLSAKYNNHKLAIFLIDIKKFQHINETYGHVVGDEILKSVAEKLKRYAQDRGLLVGRFGGDEFTVVVPKYDTDDFIKKEILSILSVLKDVYSVYDNSIRVDFFVGGSVFPDHSNDYKGLIRMADIALSYAKKNPEKRYVVYEKEIGEGYFKKNIIELELQTALAQREFYLVYQPKLSLDGKELKGYEALLRWDNKSLGTLVPLDFLAVAEESNLIVEISNWVLRKAIKENSEISKAAGKVLPLSVNMSYKQIVTQDFVNMLQNLLEEFNYSPECLQLEFSETVFTKLYNTSNEILKKIKEIGVKVVIDDFGANASNINSIANYQIDEFKISKDVICNISDNDTSKKMLNIFVMIVNEFKGAITAIGVENEKDRTFLLSSKIENIQGFYYSKPMDKESFINYVSTFN